MVHVVCAVIISAERKIFCARRPFHKDLGGFWEFPGGKVEEDEAESDALYRELNEELGLSLVPEYPLEPLIHNYPDFTIKLSPWICRMEKGSTITLHEHIDMKWLYKTELNLLEWCPADLPLLERLRELPGI